MLKINLVRFYFLFRSISILNIDSINIAVKNRLSEGINTGYQSFWNKLYKSEFPLILNVKLMTKKIEPIINR